MGGGILYNVSTTRGLLDEIRAANSPVVVEPTVVPVATDGTDGTDNPEAMIGETIETAAGSDTDDAEFRPPAGFPDEPIFLWEEF